MNRRQFTQLLGLLSAGSMLFPAFVVNAKQYLTLEQARELLWADKAMTKVALVLSDEQAKAIRSASGVRVRNQNIQVWKVDGGGWFIVDQIIGKHENIDMAFAYNEDGTVKGMEIMVYRETYGYEVANPKWRMQFHGKDYTEHLKLDKQIVNISGATLSSKHITDGINRLNQTWKLVLSQLG
jgi:Na+-translocating ferredoxin:NAD+ oxidoreductase RnfG subunit